MVVKLAFGLFLGLFSKRWAITTNEQQTAVKSNNKPKSRNILLV